MAECIIQDCDSSSSLTIMTLKVLLAKFSTHTFTWQRAFVFVNPPVYWEVLYAFHNCYITKSQEQYNAILFEMHNPVTSALSRIYL